MFNVLYTGLLISAQQNILGLAAIEFSRHESFKLYLNYTLAVYFYHLLIHTEDTVRSKVNCVIATYLEFTR
jgi:hypothetical protein